jgi:hypothetical protein
MSYSKDEAPRRWRLLVDCMIFLASAAAITLVVGGKGNCGTSISNADFAACTTFMRRKAIACGLLSIIAFALWLRHKIRRSDGN